MPSIIHLHLMFDYYTTIPTLYRSAIFVGLFLSLRSAISGLLSVSLFPIKRLKLQAQTHILFYQTTDTIPIHTLWIAHTLRNYRTSCNKGYTTMLSMFLVGVCQILKLEKNETRHGNKCFLFQFGYTRYTVDTRYKSQECVDVNISRIGLKYRHTKTIFCKVLI